MRNSSLVEWTGAENVTGLKSIPKLRQYIVLGRGALYYRVKHDREDMWTRYK